MSDKEKYIHFCENNNEEISLFLQPWWLEIISEKNEWDVAIFEKNGIIEGALPYIRRKIPFVKYIHSAPLSPAIGIYIRNKNAKYKNSSIKYQRDVLKNIIQALPKFNVSHFRFSDDIRDWRPFYWEGFIQSTY